MLLGMGLFAHFKDLMEQFLPAKLLVVSQTVEIIESKVDYGDIASLNAVESS